MISDNLLLLLVMICSLGPSLGVPAKGPPCLFPQALRDRWVDPRTNSTVSVVSDTWAGVGRCVLQLEGSHSRQAYILRSNRQTCFSCLHLEQLHENVLRHKSSSCLPQRNAAMLCRLAHSENWSHLYRASPLPSPCPEILSGSHSFSYTEYSPTQVSYIEGCGQPRSESNQCRQRSPADPQLSINYGNCPTGTLVHRTSMTQTLRCLGSWHSEGTHYFLARGEVWEYWEPGTYRNSDSQTLCMALQTDGLKLYMAQGFGSTCDGLGSALTPTNGVRNLVLQKRMRLEESCQFPAWVTEQGSWQVVSQSGAKEGTLASLDFTSSTVFTLGREGRGVRGSQQFSCSKILMVSDTEFKVQAFSQAQCLGEYHCVHGLLHPISGSLSLHLGAAAPHLEHSCVGPAFHEENPFLQVTLVPGPSSSRVVLQRSQTREPATRRPVEPVETTSLDVQVESADSLERETMARIHSYTTTFLTQVSAAVHDMASRLAPQQRTKI